VERALAGSTVRTSAGSFCITLFPVCSTHGEAGFAGGIAQENLDCEMALAALETDRARFFEILHDRVGPHLSAAGIQLDLLRMDLAERAAPMDERILEIQATLDNVIALIRGLRREADVVSAERVGLRGALDALAGRLRADFRGSLRVMAHPGVPPDPGAAQAFYHIADEAARHAVAREGCSSIEILLKSVRYGTELEIRDNGTIAEGTEGFMLMEYYARRAGIELEIETGAASETVVRGLLRRFEESA